MRIDILNRKSYIFQKSYLTCGKRYYLEKEEHRSLVNQPFRWKKENERITEGNSQLYDYKSLHF